jgi:hypothetical protein
MGPFAIGLLQIVGCVLRISNSHELLDNAKDVKLKLICSVIPERRRNEANVFALTLHFSWK